MYICILIFSIGLKPDFSIEIKPYAALI